MKKCKELFINNFNLSVSVSLLAISGIIFFISSFQVVSIIIFAFLLLVIFFFVKKPNSVKDKNKAEKENIDSNKIDDDTRQKSLKIIKKQSERLKRMIEDLLVIPDIEGAKLNVNLTEVPINAVIETSIMLVKNDTNKEIVNNLEDCTLKIIADNDRIEQVFVNLIENAIKYSKEESKITLDYEIKENKLVINVKNDYEIIPREKLKTLFDKFTRVDDKTTRTTRGTGLGLYIVKGLVAAMNGEIRLYSNENCGFCVKVFMPIAETNQNML